MARFSSHKPLVCKDIKSAEYIEVEDNGYLSLWGKIETLPFNRVKIVGFITHTYLSPDRKYGFLRIDDGTGEVVVKYFKDAIIIKSLEKGDIIMVYGRLSRYNNETQLVNEHTIKLENPNYFILHRLENTISKRFYNNLARDVEIKGYADKEALQYILSTYNIFTKDVEVILNLVEKATQQKEDRVEKEEVKAAILEYLRSREDNKAEYSQIINDLPYDENVIEQSIVDLLSEGSCYEPQPGVIKLL